MARTVGTPVSLTEVRRVIWNDTTTGLSRSLTAAFAAAQNLGFQVAGRDSLADFAGYVHDTANPVISGFNTGIITQTSIDIFWNAPTDDTYITKQQVYVDNVLRVTFNNATTTSYTITGLSPNTSYNVYVRVYDRENKTTDTAVILVTTESGNNPPVFIDPLTAQDGLDPATSVFLQWQSGDDNGVTSQTLYWGKTNPPTNTITLSSGAQQYSKTNLTNGTTYYFYIRACDGGGLCTNSSTVSHTTSVGQVLYAINLTNGTTAFNACNGFPPNQYYIDAPSFSNATTIYQDSNGTFTAQSNYYSNQSIARYLTTFGSLQSASFC